MSEAGQTRADLSAALEQTAAELQTAQQALAHWEARVSELRRQQTQLRAEYEAALQQALADELRGLHERLDAAAAAWRRRQAELAQAAALAEQLTALLADDDGLAEALQAYDDAIGQRDKLSEFPQAIRSALQQVLDDKLAELAERSAGYRALQQQRQALLQGQAVTLVLAGAGDDGQLWHWITPWATDTDDAGDLRGSELAVAAFSGLGRSERWTIDDIDSGDWQGRQVITLLGSYHGALEEALQDAVQQLTAALQEHDGQITVIGERLAGDLWQVQSRPVISAAAEIDEPTPETLASDWFNAADLRSWTRKASKRINPAQRRMRTLVLRLLARGHINDAGVSAAELLAGLPEPQAAALRNDIAQLCERQLLLPAGGRSGQLTLNPALLDDYRSLILRDPGEVWAGTGG
jgi:hypothetical protein